MNKKIILGLLIGTLICSTVVYAISTIARDIVYDNSYSNLVDKNDNNVTNVQDAIDALYTKVISGGGGSLVSELINNYTITNSELVGVTTKININGNITTTDSSDIKGYMIIANDDIVSVTTSLPYSLKLNAGTNYTIKVKAIDKDGNTKESSNSVSVTTPNVIPSPLEYPIITTNGVANVKYVNPGDPNDFTYGLDLSMDCTASDALDKKAYDGDESTYVEKTDTKNKFIFGNDMYVRFVGFKIDATSGHLYDWAEGSGYITIGSESTQKNGYWYSTHYSANSTAWRNNKCSIGVRTYEIIYNTNS